MAKQPITSDETVNINVGRRLRELRMGKGLSIRSLAEQSKLNVNTLSLIENGHTSPSVSTLQSIAQTLNVPISTFFETDHENKEVVYQSSEHRPVANFTHGTIEDLGAGMLRFGAEPLIITLKPKADSGKTPIVHTGREFVYCLEGHVTYQVDGHPYQLRQGDSLMFEAYLPHHWRNENLSPSRLLLVLCPMDERDQPSERHFWR
ncbi:MAG: cupin [Anaerolineales bacterium]|nr:cupin domain-containing protein [Anaerolineae bacterium]PWB71454.1 MAG: cupin [Anaerolineales bacterium]